MRTLCSTLALCSVSWLLIPAAQDAPALRRGDVETLDGIVAALYDCVSGPAGEARDWSRFHSLFHPEAIRFAVVRPDPSGSVLSVLDPERYQAWGEDWFKTRALYEKEIARSVQRFGHIAQVFSTYELRTAPDQDPPEARGINSFQLFWDDDRWWITSLLWEAESPDFELPAEFLPK